MNKGYKSFKLAVIGMTGDNNKQTTHLSYTLLQPGTQMLQEINANV